MEVLASKILPCYHPITAYRSRTGLDKKTGKWPIVFNVSKGYQDLSLEVPCGQCIGCRLERSRQWAVRCVHEMQMHDDNSFITLTFSDDYINSNYSLNPQDFVRFMKRLRKFYGDGIRYFHAGEYGETYGRPHHHAILFGLDFKDKILKQLRNGIPVYDSMELQRLWPYGMVEVGTATFESAAYVARYCVSKVYGDAAKDYYGDRVHPYCTMSRRPGIGSSWYDKYRCDVYPYDRMIIRGGIKCKPAKYYDKKLELQDVELFNKLKYSRKKEGEEHRDTDERLLVREEVQLLRNEKLLRNYE